MSSSLPPNRLNEIERELNKRWPESKMRSVHHSFLIQAFILQAQMEKLQLLE
jgi:hypothetical protein